MERRIPTADTEKVPQIQAVYQCRITQLTNKQFFLAT
jgi:hypothetical protein